MWMLDTDTCCYILRERPPQVLERLDRVARDEIVLSTIVCAELRYRAARLRSKKRADTIEAWLALFVILPWDDAASKAYARIRAGLEASGKPIGKLDMPIAAHAVACGALLVTSNTRHFSQVPGLRIENWA